LYKREINEYSLDIYSFMQLLCKTTSLHMQESPLPSFVAFINNSELQSNVN